MLPIVGRAEFAVQTPLYPNLVSFSISSLRPSAPLKSGRRKLAAGQATINTKYTVTAKNEAVLKKCIVPAGDNLCYCSVFFNNNPHSRTGTVKGRSGTEMSFMNLCRKSSAYVPYSTIHKNVGVLGAGTSDLSIGRMFYTQPHLRQFFIHTFWRSSSPQKIEAESIWICTRFTRLSDYSFELPQ